jgi:hypothetical protein
VNHNSNESLAKRTLGVANVKEPVQVENEKARKQARANQC